MKTQILMVSFYSANEASKPFKDSYYFKFMAPF